MKTPSEQTRWLAVLFFVGAVLFGAQSMIRGELPMYGILDWMATYILIAPFIVIAFSIKNKQ